MYSGLQCKIFKIVEGVLKREFESHPTKKEDGVDVEWQITMSTTTPAIELGIINMFNNEIFSRSC